MEERAPVALLLLLACATVHSRIHADQTLIVNQAEDDPPSTPPRKCTPAFCNLRGAWAAAVPGTVISIQVDPIMEHPLTFDNAHNDTSKPIILLSATESKRKTISAGTGRMELFRLVSYGGWVVLKSLVVQGFTGSDKEHSDATAILIYNKEREGEKMFIMLEILDSHFTKTSRHGDARSVIALLYPHGTRENYGSVRIVDSEFTDNQASILTADAMERVSLVRCRFLRNGAAGSGPREYSPELINTVFGPILIQGSEFRENRVSTSLVNTRSPLTVEDTIFANNSGSRHPGLVTSLFEIDVHDLKCTNVTSTNSSNAVSIAMYSGDMGFDGCDFSWPESKPFPFITGTSLAKVYNRNPGNLNMRGAYTDPKMIQGCDNAVWGPFACSSSCTDLKNSDGDISGYRCHG